MTYSEYLLQLKLNSFNFNNINLDYSKLLVNLKSELDKLKIFNNEQYLKLNQLFVLSLGGERNHYETTFNAFETILKKELPNEKIKLNKIVLDLKNINILILKKENELEDLNSILIKAKEKRIESNKNLNRSINTFSKIEELNEELSLISKFIEKHNISNVSKSANVGIIKKKLNTIDAQLFNKIKKIEALKDKISTMDDFVTFKEYNLFNDFNEFTEIVNSLQNQNENIKFEFDKAYDFFNKINRQINKKRKDIKNIKSEKNLLTDKLTPEYLFKSIFDKLTNQEQNEIWKCYGIDYESLKKDNEIRVHFIKQEIETVLNHFRTITTIIKETDSKIEKLNKSVLNNTNTVIESLERVEMRQNNLDYLLEEYKKKHSVYADNQEQYFNFKELFQIDLPDYIQHSKIDENQEVIFDNALVKLGLKSSSKKVFA